MIINNISYNSYNDGNAKDITLEKLKLEKDECGYYLAATYIIEDDHAIRKIDIPKIRLKLNEKQFSIKACFDPHGMSRTFNVDIGFGYLPLDLATNEAGLEYVFTNTLLKEKYAEMTLDEIEKKLGYKVKIVNKQNRES